MILHRRGFVNPFLQKKGSGPRRCPKGSFHLLLGDAVDAAPAVAASRVGCPPINAGGGHQHPTQTLTDLLTIHRLKARRPSAAPAGPGRGPDGSPGPRALNTGAAFC